MHEYRIFETEQFRKDPLSIARAGHEEIAGKLRRFVCSQRREHLHFGPHIRKLKGFTPETWSYRIGSWRFFYEIDDQEPVVWMIAAAHRGWRIDLLGEAPDRSRRPHRTPNDSTRTGRIPTSSADGNPSQQAMCRHMTNP